MTRAAYCFSLVIGLKNSQVVLKLLQFIIKLFKLTLARQNIFILYEQGIIELFGALLQFSREVRQHVLNLRWIQTLKVVSRINLVLLFFIFLLFICNTLLIACLACLLVCMVLRCIGLRTWVETSKETQSTWLSIRIRFFALRAI